MLQAAYNRMKFVLHTSMLFFTFKNESSVIIFLQGLISKAMMLIMNRKTHIQSIISATKFLNLDIFKQEIYAGQSP